MMVAAVLLPAAAGASVAPDAIDFGEVITNHSTAVTVTNDSAGDWLMGTPSFESGSAFSVTGTDCVYLFTHAPINTCTVTVQFNGQSLPPGVYSDTLDVPHTDTDNVVSVETVAVEGTVGDHDFTPPSVPANLHTSALTPTGVTLAWDAAAPADGVAGYYVLEWTGSDWAILAATSGNPYMISSLTPGSSHTYAVQAYDSAGNVSAPSNQVQVTTPVPPPSPGNVTVVPGLSSVEFSWDLTPEGDTTALYRVQRLIAGVWTPQVTAEAPADGVTVAGLAAHTSYSFRVLGEDADGLTSTPVLISVTTLADTSAPTAPTVSAHATTSAGTRLQWSGSTDDVGVTGYRISMYQDGAWVPMGAPLAPDATGYTVTGLAPDTGYSFGVAALDAAGNASQTTIDVTTARAPRFTQAPRVGFVTGGTATKSLVPTRVTWAVEAGSRCKTEVGRAAGSGWDSTVLSNPLATTFDWKVGYNAARTARVQVTDCAGTPSGWVQTAAFAPVQVAASVIAYSPGWATANGAAYLGGSDRHSAHNGASVTVRLKNARAVALVGSCGSTRGSARVYLDGALSATISERCAAGAGRVLYTHRWTASGAHTLKVVVVGTKRVDVDGFITL